MPRLAYSGPELRRRPSKGTNINPFTPRELLTHSKRSREESERLVLVCYHCVNI